MVLDYLDGIERYIDELKIESFEGWTEEAVKGYLTACESIKQKVKEVKRSSILDSMDDHE